MAVYMDCESRFIVVFEDAGSHTGIAFGVLLHRSDLSLEVVSRHRDNGVGSSVRVAILHRLPGTLSQYSRPQPSYFIRCMFVGHLPTGSAHSPGKLPRKTYANGLGVCLNAVVAANDPTYRNFTDRGNFLVITSTIACTIGLTWGGITAPWGSAKVLVPLVLGLVGLGVFIAYEATLAHYPLVCAFLLCALIGIVSHLPTPGAILFNDKPDQP